MKPSLTVLAFVSLIGLAAFILRLVPTRSHAGFEPVRAASCEDHYNFLLKSAKTALLTGDRVTTVHLLEQAERMGPTLQGASPQAVMCKT